MQVESWLMKSSALPVDKACLKYVLCRNKQLKAIPESANTIFAQDNFRFLVVVPKNLHLAAKDEKDHSSNAKGIADASAKQAQNDRQKHNVYQSFPHRLLFKSEGLHQA